MFLQDQHVLKGEGSKVRSCALEVGLNITVVTSYWLWKKHKSIQEELTLRDVFSLRKNTVLGQGSLSPKHTHTVPRER